MHWVVLPNVNLFFWGVATFEKKYRYEIFRLYYHFLTCRLCPSIVSVSTNTAVNIHQFAGFLFGQSEPPITIFSRLVTNSPGLKMGCVQSLQWLYQLGRFFKLGWQLRREQLTWFFLQNFMSFQKHDRVVVSHSFYVHPDPWGNDPIWLLFFKWVETTN